MPFPFAPLRSFSAMVLGKGHGWEGCPDGPAHLWLTVRLYVLRCAWNNRPKHTYQEHQTSFLCRSNIVIHQYITPGTMQ